MLIGSKRRPLNTLRNPDLGTEKKITVSNSENDPQITQTQFHQI